MSQLTHVLIDGIGCPSWCTTDHGKNLPHVVTVRHDGKVLQIGGARVYPTIHVDVTEVAALRSGPRLRVVIDGADDRFPTNVIYFGLRNAERMARLLELAGDETGLSNALWAAVATLDAEQKAAQDIAAERREQMRASR